MNNKPQVYKARVAERYYLTENNKYLFIRLELVEPREIHHLAGQYLSIKVGEQGLRRSYSIASTPDVTHAVSLVADLSPNGLGSAYLQSLQLGEMVEFLAPLGRFTIEQSQEGKIKKKVVFVGTGSGITPLKPMIEDMLRNKGEQGVVRLHWGLRTEEDVFWLDNFERMMEEYPNFVFDLTLSRPRPGWRLCSGRVTECLERDMKDVRDWRAYLCGNFGMIRDVTNLFVSRGMSQDEVYTERFF